MADLPARSTGDSSTAHISDHNTMHALVGELEELSGGGATALHSHGGSAPLPDAGGVPGSVRSNSSGGYYFTREHVNVKDYGAKGRYYDDSADDQSAIQSALNAMAGLKGYTGTNSGDALVFPPGAYGVSSTLTWTGDHAFVSSSGYQATELVWTGTAGTGPLLYKSGGTDKLSGIKFEGDVSKPSSWFNQETNSGQSWDFGDWIEDCFFTDWNTTTGTAAIISDDPALVNAHMRRLRFGGGKGYCMIIRATDKTRSIVLRDWTIDSSNANQSYLGLMKIVNTSSSASPNILIEGARVEDSGLGDPKIPGIANNSGYLVTVETENPATIALARWPLMLTVISCGLQPPKTTDTYIVKVNDNGRSSAFPSVNLIGVDFTEGGPWAALIGGDINTSDPLPDVPTGRCQAMFLGPNAGGGGIAETYKQQMFASQWSVGTFLELDDASAPATPAADKARLYFDDSSKTLKYKDDTGTIRTIATV